MRIVHQLLSGDVAGGQVVALRLAHGAAEAGHDALLVSPTDGPIAERAAALGVRLRVLPLRRSFRADDAWRLARLLRGERADVLHTHTHLAGNVLGRLGARLARVPVVAHMHIENAFRPPGIGRAMQVALDNASARSCARIVVVSEATRTILLRQGYPARTMEVVYNGVEPTPVEGVRLTDAPSIALVGRLAPVKGQLELIRALPQLDVAVAVLVGRDLERGGAFERELEREAQALGVRERVLLAGQRDDVAALLAGCDVCTLPSHVEGFPLVLLEAMAQARPVVATPVGGTPELVVDGETGTLVPPRDPDALAHALRELLSSTDRARRLGEAGRRRVVEHFTAEAMTERILGVYREVVRTMRP